MSEENKKRLKEYQKNSRNKKKKLTQRLSFFHIVEKWKKKY